MTQWLHSNASTYSDRVTIIVSRILIESRDMQRWSWWFRPEIYFGEGTFSSIPSVASLPFPFPSFPRLEVAFKSSYEICGSAVSSPPSGEGTTYAASRHVPWALVSGDRKYPSISVKRNVTMCYNVQMCLSLNVLCATVSLIKFYVITLLHFTLYILFSLVTTLDKMTSVITAAAAISRHAPYAGATTQLL